MRERNQPSEIALVETERRISEKSKEAFFQVDFLKAAMIFLVIFDHMVSWNIKSEIGVTLWERISIPVFLVIMGFNMGLSFQRNEAQTLKELYSKSYFKKKIIRYVVPFLVLYAASTFIGLIMYNFDLIEMYNTQYYPNHGIINLFTGFMIFWGPGNWFIPLLFQAILIMPLLYKAFTKKPVLTLIMCFVVEIAMQLIVFFFIGEITSWEESHYYTLFATSVLFYLPGIGLGMWFSFGYKLTEKRNLFMWILFPISLAFCIAHEFFNFRFRVDGLPLLRGDYHFLIVPYSAFLVLLALNFLPQKSEGRISRAITLIGKSTYHILLTQILGYGMITAFWGTHYGIDTGFGPGKILDMIAAWILFISFGILWYIIDQNKDLLRRILYYINFFIVYSSLLFLSFWVQGFWVPLPLIIIIIYVTTALITRFRIKRPLNTKVLISWTIFLITTYIMMIRQVIVFQTHEYPISMFFILYSLLGALIGTGLWYTQES